MSTAAKLNPTIRQARRGRADTRRQINDLGKMPCYAHERINRIVTDPRFPAAYKQSQHDQLLFDLEEFNREKDKPIEGMAVNYTPPFFDPALQAEIAGWDANGSPAA